MEAHEGELLDRLVPELTKRFTVAAADLTEGIGLSPSAAVDLMARSAVMAVAAIVHDIETRVGIQADYDALVEGWGEGLRRLLNLGTQPESAH